MKILLSIALLSVSLGGCTVERLYEDDGALRAEPSTKPGSDYVVHMRNLVDFGFEPDDKANREGWVLSYLKNQCPTGRIVDTSVIDTGSYGSGRPARTYSVYVKCAG